MPEIADLIASKPGPIVPRGLAEDVAHTAVKSSGLAQLIADVGLGGATGMITRQFSGTAGSLAGIWTTEEAVRQSKAYGRAMTLNMPSITEMTRQLEHIERRNEQWRSEAAAEAARLHAQFQRQLAAAEREAKTQESGFLRARAAIEALYQAQSSPPQERPLESTPDGLTVVRDELVTPTRRGPKPQSDTEWLADHAALLAWHCQQDGVTNPFSLSRSATAKGSGYSPKHNGLSLAHALIERQYQIVDLHLEALRIMGFPPRPWE